eukprot:s972_g15.t1
MFVPSGRVPLQTHEPAVSVRRRQGSLEIPVNSETALDEGMTGEDHQIDADELLYQAADAWSSHGSTSTARLSKPRREGGPGPLTLVSAWWSVDTVMVRGPRGLWGCAALLASETLGRILL